MQTESSVSIPTLLSRRSSYVSAKTRRDNKLINKRQVAQLFGVSMHTIDCWLHDGKLPKPKRTFPRQKWNYKELVVRTRLSQKIGSYSQKEIELKKINARGLAMIRQATCAVCGFPENCDFKVMNDAWKTIVPIESRKQIVCVKCFEAFASSRITGRVKTIVGLLENRGVSRDSSEDSK